MNPSIAMRASSSGTGPVETLDNFYLLLAENGDECLELPWYRTSVAFRDGLRRFRSELALPGLRLESIDGKKYFIPEARFTGMAENKPDSEHAAAVEACDYLRKFVQKSELDPTEWRIDNDNPLYKSIVESQQISSTSEVEEVLPSEGHRFLVIAPVERGIRKTRVVRSSSRRREPVSSSRSGYSSSSDGQHLSHLGSEINLLKLQMDRLTSLVESHHSPPSHPVSMTPPPASTSYHTEIRPE